MPDPAAAPLLQVLSAFPETRSLGLEDLVPLPSKGVNHDHLRLRGTGLLLRLPRRTPWLGDPVAQLALEAAAFRRAEPAGVTPRLVAVIEPSASLPLGGLVVEDIEGHAPRLPDDLDAIAEALARLHSPPLPPLGERPPLPDHSAIGPIAATLTIIETQRPFLDRARLAPETIAALAEDYAWARRYATETSPGNQPIALVGTDTHPGNFVIRRDGRAVLVDLERVCYGSPAIDLAHATLYTSTTWDLEVQAVLSPAEVAGFYRRYLAEVGPERAALLRPWLGPSRRLTWLRTMMWAVRLRALDESGRLSLNPRLAHHIRARLDDFFDPGTVARVRAEWLQGAALEV